MKPLALILAVVFVIIAILYWTGHGIPPGVHTKHGILAIFLALLCLVWYRFQGATATR